MLYESGLAALREVLISRRRPIAISTGTPVGVNTPTAENEPDGEDGPRSRHLKATCACPYVIRVAKKTLENTVIRCESCGESFRASP